MSGEPAISRVLSWTAIHLEYASPRISSDLPGSIVGHDIASLFDLAPSGVYLAAECYHQRGALLPHPFTLTGCCEISQQRRRSALCCTFRGFTPPRRYLALCPVEPGLSSIDKIDSDCLANSPLHRTVKRHHTTTSIWIFISIETT